MSDALPPSLKYANQNKLFMDQTTINNVDSYAWTFKVQIGPNEKYIYIDDKIYRKFINQLINDIESNKFNFPIWQMPSPTYFYYQIITLNEYQIKEKDNHIKIIIENTFKHVSSYIEFDNGIEDAKTSHIYSSNEYIYIIYPFIFVHTDLSKKINSSLSGYIISNINNYPLLPYVSYFEKCLGCFSDIRKIIKCNKCLGTGKGREIRYTYQYSYSNGKIYNEDSNKIRLSLIHLPFEGIYKENDIEPFIAIDGSIPKQLWNKTLDNPYVPHKISNDINIEDRQPLKYRTSQYSKFEEIINNTLKLSGLDYGYFRLFEMKPSKSKITKYKCKMLNEREQSLEFILKPSGVINVNEKFNSKFKERREIKSSLENIKNLTFVFENIKSIDDLTMGLKKRKRDIELYTELKNKKAKYIDMVKMLINSK